VNPVALFSWFSWLFLATGCLKPADSDLVTQLDREVIALHKKNQMLENQLQSCSEGDLNTELYAQLNQVFSGTEITVEREGSRAVVVIPGELVFSPGSTKVRDEATMVTDLLATALTLHQDTHIWVIGHTDDDALVGTLRRRYGDNWGLSTARASAFMHLLVDKFGIAASRFTIAGQGETRPVATNDTPEGRVRNRRLVVVIGPPEDYR